MLLALLATLTCGQLLEPASPDGPIYSSPSRMNRLAFFEAFPASGAGTTTACSTTAPTGARGEALAFARTGNGTCTRTATGGLATTGIADGDLVVLSGNVARVEYDSAGTLGLLVESARTNSLPRYNDLTNLAWSDVGTPTVTDGATDPFGGTSGDTITDNDGAAYEGRAQTISVSAGAAYFGHCFVKAGTATTARITVDGTAGTITGLSASTWSIVEVADASASGASIVVQVMVGNATTVTGTVIFGGCQVEAGTYRTSIIPTVGAAVVRNAESATFSVSIPTTAGVCTAATLTLPSTAALVAGSGLFVPGLSALAGSFGSPYFWAYSGGTGTSLSIDGTGSSGAPSGYVSAVAALTTARYVAGHNGTAWSICRNGTCSTNGSSSSWSSPTYGHIKLNNPSNNGDGIWTRLQVDPTWSRCQ